MRSLPPLIAAASVLAGCVSENGRDWLSEPGSVAFEEATSTCRGQRAMAVDAAAATAAFTLCMNAKGWRRR